jgi:hypothetical protein
MRSVQKKKRILVLVSLFLSLLIVLAFANVG